MITGTINIVTDINLAMQWSQQCKVLFIGELNSQLPPNFIEYSILLPPVEALEAEVNGDTQTYNYIYTQHLTYNPYCQEAIATILAAINRGVNIIFYIEEGNNLSHKEFLMSYFFNVFGITLGSDMTNFGYKCDYVGIINTVIYTWLGEQMMPFRELMESVSGAANIKNICIRYGINALERIAEENHLYMKEDELMMWIDNYKRRLSTVLGSLIVPSRTGSKYRTGDVIIWKKEKKK